MTHSSSNIPHLPAPDRRSDEVLVRVNGISKKFCRDLKKSLWYGTKDIFSELNPFASLDASSQSELRPGEFWANKDVSFELRRGECLGLIGRNGAGKTTLLKMLNGLIKPDAGSIEMRGRVGALIALGAGFNPILTGRENIYVNASVLGLMKHEIDNKIDEIIDFAEISAFIDSPVQSYSSGMQVRLGFAVATALKPDVLILDEVLAVGDASFRNKCYQRISEIRRHSSIIFVSHNIEQIGRICDRCILLNGGKSIYDGTVEQGVEAYSKICVGDVPSQPQGSMLSMPLTAMNVSLSRSHILWNEKIEIRLNIGSVESVKAPIFRIVFYNSSESWIADSVCSPINDEIPSGESSYEISTTGIPLKSGTYWITIHVIDELGSIIGWSHKQHSLSISGTGPKSFADCSIPSKCYQLEK